MRYIQGVFVISLALTAMNSCRSVKTIQTAIAKKDTTQIIPVVDLHPDSLRFIQQVLDTVYKNYIDFQTFSAKTKVHFENSNGKRHDFNANIRLKKDSIILIYITGPFELDVLRALIKPDSVIIVDKMEKTVTVWAVDHLQEIIHIPMTFTDLQNLLIGNPVFLDSNINSYKKDDNSISLVCIGALFKHFLTVNKNDYTLLHSKLDDVDPNRARTADLTYGDYQFSKNGIRFSTYRSISVSEKSKLDIKMEYKQFEFNKVESFPFPIPRNYRRQ
jgi:23S rRNA U2552 (ribose-2'-O)-methylase RlmE/FtsJ